MKLLVTFLLCSFTSIALAHETRASSKQIFFDLQNAYFGSYLGNTVRCVEL